MNVEKPIQVGVSEKATNNPPIEILVQNEATLAGLPKTWPEGTVAHTPGNVNRWKWQSGAWVAISDVDSLSELSDVNITNPTNGQAIIYDGTAQKWVNGSAGGGGGGSDVFIVNSLYDETISNDRLDKTAAEIVAALQAGKTMLVCSFSDSSYGTSTSFNANSYTCTCTFSSDDGYYSLDITASGGVSFFHFSASSADAYPTHYDPD